MKMQSSPETMTTDIVIVDDDEYNLKLLTDILNAEGYTVRPANSGALALRSIRLKTPALILLDIQMPDLNGYDVCRRLKADPQTRDIPIIFISVLDTPHDKVKGFQMGGVDFITRPFENIEVLARVHTHLALRRTQVELEHRTAELQAAHIKLNAEILERQASAAALQQYQEHLEEVIAERTAALQQEIAERQRMEETLRMSESQVHALLNAIQETAFLMDSQGTVLAANTTAAQRLATTVEHFVGNCVYDFLPPESAQQRKAHYVDVVRTGQPVQFEDRRNAQIFRNIIYPVKDVAGAVQNVAILAIDISDLRQAEHDRQRNEARLEALLQLYQMIDTPISQIADFTMEQGIRLTDSTMGFLIFLTPDETIGIVHSWSKAAMAECEIVDKPLQFMIAETGLWGEVARQRQPIVINDFAAPHPAKRGFPAGHVPISRYLSIPVFEGSRMVAIAAVANKAAAYHDLDITQLQLFMQGMWGILQRKRAEEELQRANAYNRSLIEASLDPLVTIGADGKIMDVNTATEKMTEYDRYDLIGADFSDYFTEPERARAGYQQVFRDGLVRDYPLEIRHRDGSLTSVLYNAVVYRDNAGQILGVFAAARDMTERKQAEEQLRQAKETAEAANHAKSQFLSNMSHELRTPLTSMLGYAQLLRRQQNLTASQQQSLDTIVRNGEHLLVMISELLDLSKIEAGKMTLINQPFALRPLLQIITANIRVQAEAKGIFLLDEIAPDVPVLVSGDETHLRHILLNLLSNAVKFTEQGGVTLRVHSPQPDSPPSGESQGAGVLRFEVEDTGPGIPADHVVAIFEPFYQIAAEKTKGTGLGLSISRQLTRLMHSDLKVRSIAGQGSVFWFDLTLPVVESSSTAPIVTELEPVVSRPISPDSQVMVPPPLEDLSALYELARLGNIVGLRKRLVLLETSEPRFQPFVNHLKILVKDIQLKKMCHWLRQYLEKEEEL